METSFFQSYQQWCNANGLYLNESSFQLWRKKNLELWEKVRFNYSETEEKLKYR